MEKLKKEFENIIKNENDLIGLSDNNLLLDRDGDFDDYLVSTKWDFFKMGYELRKKEEKNDST